MRAPLTDPPLLLPPCCRQASASTKDSFFQRKLAENAHRPEGLPPSQGGKYVGFGSAPAPQRPGAGAAAGSINVDEVGGCRAAGLAVCIGVWRQQLWEAQSTWLLPCCRRSA